MEFSLIGGEIKKAGTLKLPALDFTSEFRTDSFHAASYAVMVYQYSVDESSPISKVELVTDDLIYIPSWYILYPVTPTSSVDTFHERSIWLKETIS